MPKDESEVRIAISVSQAVRDDLADVSFLLRLSEKDFVAKAIAAALKAVVAQKGDTFKKALEVVKAARKEDT